MLRRRITSRFGVRESPDEHAGRDVLGRNNLTTLHDSSAAPVRSHEPEPVSRPTLCFVYSPTSGPSRRAEGFLAQVLQRRQNHRAFALRRIDCVEEPGLAERLGATTVPTLLVVDERCVQARLDGVFGCKEIEQLLEPWLDQVERRRTAGGGAASAGGRVRRDLEAPLGRISMILPPDLALPSWQAIGVRIGAFAGAPAWWLADWAAYGEDRYGAQYRQAVTSTGFTHQTLRNYAWVARRFEVSRRRDELSFAHHAEVAALADAEQDSWLDRAEREGWSRSELRTRLRAERRPQDERSVEHVRLDGSSTHADRWPLAAGAGGLELPDWLIAVADRAVELEQTA
jgi:hypothetical protein